MNRRRRPFAAALAALALVFAQFAAVAHACDLYAAPAQAKVMAHPVGCSGSIAIDETSPNQNVCAEHCQYGFASVDNFPPAPDAGGLAGPVFRVDSPDAATSAVACQDWRLPLAAPPPSHAILFGVLRL